MLVHLTHTAHSGNGDRTGDEAEAFVHTDIKVCCPGKEKEKRLSCRICGRKTKCMVSYETSYLFKYITGLTSPHLEVLVQGREDMYPPQSKASPLEEERERGQPNSLVLTVSSIHCTSFTHKP